jgi:uncharacterized damage-inducible protein DinB
LINASKSTSTPAPAGPASSKVWRHSKDDPAARKDSARDPHRFDAPVRHVHDAHFLEGSMDTLARPIVALYGLSNGILNTGIGDLSDDHAKARSRGGAGPSIAWTIGHLCQYKIKVLELLGHSRENPFGSTFEHAATDGTGYPPLAELAASFSALNSELCAALATAGGRLEEAMPGSGPHNEKRILDTVLFLAWHEAYHIGAIGAIRREQGRKAIAELVRGA